jgi:hypothetical protein
LFDLRCCCTCPQQSSGESRRSCPPAFGLLLDLALGLTPVPLLESNANLHLMPDSVQTIGSGGRGVLHSEVKEEPAQRAADTNGAEHPARRFKRQQEGFRH